MKTNDLDIALGRVFKEYLFYSQLRVVRELSTVLGVAGFRYSFKSDGDVVLNPKTKKEINVFAAKNSNLMVVTGWDSVFRTDEADRKKAISDTVKFIGKKFEQAGYQSNKSLPEDKIEYSNSKLSENFFEMGKVKEGRSDKADLDRSVIDFKAMKIKSNRSLKR